MINFNEVTTIYTKSIKTLRLKISHEYVAEPGNDENKAESPNEVYEILKAIYRQLDDDQEHLVMLVLNFSNDIVGYKVISSGGQTSSVGDSKVIFKNALFLGASKILLAHNHPSGTKRPSKQDIKFTNKVIGAGKVMDIPLVDHLIFTQNGYLSMRSEELCEFEPLTE